MQATVKHFLENITLFGGNNPFLDLKKVILDLAIGSAKMQYLNLGIGEKHEGMPAEVSYACTKITGFTFSISNIPGVSLFVSSGALFMDVRYIIGHINI